MTACLPFYPNPTFPIRDIPNPIIPKFPNIPKFPKFPKPDDPDYKIKSCDICHGSNTNCLSCYGKGKIFY